MTFGVMMDLGASYSALPLWLAIFCYGIAALEIALCISATKNEPVVAIGIGSAVGLSVATGLIQTISTLNSSPQYVFLFSLICAAFSCISNLTVFGVAKKEAIAMVTSAGTMLALYIVAFASYGMQEKAVPTAFFILPLATVMLCGIYLAIAVKNALVRLAKKPKA